MLLHYLTGHYPKKLVYAATEEGLTEPNGLS